jgi:hypothetical protein
MLEKFLRLKLDDLFDELGAENLWFQQDGTTAHTSRRSLGILREMFPGYVDSLRGDIGWLSLSPDLTPCHFSLWGYLKAQVYQHRPLTMEGPKEAVTQEVAAIPLEITHRVMKKYWERLKQCIDNEGRHFSDVVLKIENCIMYNI